MNVGCLLIHGWTGSSFEMNPLVAPLEKMGLRVRNIMLPGHGTTFEDFQNTYWDDWEQAVEKEYEDLASEVDAVFVVGLSMGGALALHLAAKYPVAGVVPLAAPLYVYSFIPWEMKDWRIAFTPILRRIKPVFSLGERSEEHKKISPWKGYDDFVSIPQLQELIDGVGKVRREVVDVTAPILIVQAKTDKTVPLGNVFLIAKTVSSDDIAVKLLSIEEKVTGHHVITTHVETSEKVIQLVKSFINDNL